MSQDDSSFSSNQTGPLPRSTTEQDHSFGVDYSTGSQRPWKDPHKEHRERLDRLEANVLRGIIAFLVTAAALVYLALHHVTATFGK